MRTVMKKTTSWSTSLFGARQRAPHAAQETLIAVSVVVVVVETEEVPVHHVELELAAVYSAIVTGAPHLMTMPKKSCTKKCWIYKIAIAIETKTAKAQKVRLRICMIPTRNSKEPYAVERKRKRSELRTVQRTQSALELLAVLAVAVAVAVAIAVRAGDTAAHCGLEMPSHWAQKCKGAGLRSTDRLIPSTPPRWETTSSISHKVTLDLCSYLPKILLPHGCRFLCAGHSSCARC
jgi:hypothetical protein